MQGIPFGKFFDTAHDKDLIESFELIDSKELDFEDTVYLLKNNLAGGYYVVVEAEHGADWDEVDGWTKQVLQDQPLSLEEIPPKSPDWYATHHLFRVVFEF